MILQIWCIFLHIISYSMLHPVPQIDMQYLISTQTHSTGQDIEEMMTNWRLKIVEVIYSIAYKYLLVCSRQET